MKRKTLKILLVAVIGLFALDSMGIPIVHYERTKSGCGLLGCAFTKKVKDMVMLEDDSDAWSIDIECRGKGFSFCPHGIAPQEEPGEIENRTEMQFILDYIQDKVDQGDTSGSEYVKVTDADGNVWSYLVEWNVSSGEGEVDDEYFSIQRIGLFNP